MDTLVIRQAFVINISPNMFQKQIGQVFFFHRKCLPMTKIAKHSVIVLLMHDIIARKKKIVLD